MEVKYVKVVNRGSVTGEEYEWHMMELENGKIVAMRINFDAIQELDGEDYDKCILPVGECVYDEDCEAYNLIKRECRDYEVIDDFYIDMDGDAGHSKTVPQGLVMGALVAIEILVPVVALAAFVGLTLFFHMIGVKIGIFPPLIRRKQ